MYGRLRNKQRPQAQRDETFNMASFSGALNVDKPASKLGLIRPGRRTIYNEMPVCDNFIAYPDRLEGRSGTQLFSNTTLPGSGTVHAILQHPVSKKFVLHRGTALWYADSAMASWTQLYNTGNVSQSATIAGDTSAQFSVIFISGANISNTNAGVLYWNLSRTGGLTTISIYKDLAKTQLVSQGFSTPAGAGNVICQQQNKSTLRVYVILNAFVINDTDAGNTLTTAYQQSIVEDAPSSLTLYKNDMILNLGPATFSGNKQYIDMTALVIYILSGQEGFGFPQISVTDANSKSGAFPYGRRYLKTFSRIVDSNGNPDPSGINRTTGILKFEGPSNTPTLNGSYALQTSRDYGEVWTANPVSGANPSTIYWNAANNDNLYASQHYTTISIYATLDIGVNGIDPITGNGNNEEIYVWLDDIDLTSNNGGFADSKGIYTDQTPDSVLRARLAAGGYSLKTRFWTNLPGGDISAIAGAFMYSAFRGQNKITYCQLVNPENIGFYRPDVQFMNTTDGIQAFRGTQDTLAILCTQMTYYSNFKVYQNVSDLDSVFVLNGPVLISSTIGCSDYGSIADIDSSSFIAHCSDHSIRVFSGITWLKDDYSSNKVHSIIRSMIMTGSVGAYFAGVYLLWYSTSSSDTFPTKCLRLGLGNQSGDGWTTISGASFPFPPQNVGSVLIIDTNSIQRLLILDKTTSLFHWVETFASRALTKVYKDAVATDTTGGTEITPKFRTIEIAEPDESDDTYHENSNIFIRPAGTSYTGTITANAYVNGNTSPVATIDASLTGGDIQFFERVRGQRIQLEYVFSKSGVVVVSTQTIHQSHDTKNIGNGPSETTEASNQLAISSNLKHWLTRPRKNLNLATAVPYTLTGTAPTLISSPDGNSYGLSFLSGSNYSQTDLNIYNTGFTVMFWAKYNLADTSLIIGATPQFTVAFTSATNIRLNGSGATDTTISSIVAWGHIALVNSSAGKIDIYVNGVFVAQVSVTTPTASGTAFIYSYGINLFDIKVQKSILTAAQILYYYNNIINQSGIKVLPLV